MTELCFRAGGAAVRVRAPAEVARLVERLYPAYRAPCAEVPPAAGWPRPVMPDAAAWPGREPPRPLPVEIRATPIGDRWEIAGPLGRARGDDALDAAAAVEVGIARALLDGFAGHLHLHAGAVRTAAGAVLLSGASGAGKSTLTAALSLGGLPTYGDDVVLLEPSAASLHPFRRLLKVQRDTWHVLGLAEGDEGVGTVWPEVALLDPERRGGGWATPAAVTAIVFPRWRAGAPVRLERLPGGEATVALMSQAVNLASLGGDGVRAVATLVDAAPAYRMEYGELTEAMREVRRLGGG